MTMTTQGEHTITLHKAEADALSTDSTESTEAVDNAMPSTSTSCVKTPPRHSPYSVDPSKTPITSTKRPRNTVARSNSGSVDGNGNRTPMSVSNTPVGPSRSASTRSIAESPMSPMHSPKAVEDRAEDIVTAIFSPAAQFLNDHASDEAKEGEQQGGDMHHPVQQDAEALNTSDDDISMTRPEQPADSEEFNPWQFIQMLPHYDAVSHTRPAVALPPPTGNKKSLVLDLDETLVHCSVDAPETPADFTFPVAFHGVTYTVHVKRRPGLDKFLQVVSQHFEVILFTASQKVYADTLLNILDPDGIYFHHRLFRESCLAVEGNFLKDLTVTGRDLSTTVLVDNSPHAFGYQVDNGIPIESWFDCPHDTELAKLERFLVRQVLHAEDVRVPVRNKFLSYHLVETAPAMF